MGKKKNSYYLRDLDDCIVGTDMVESDTYGAKSRRSSPRRAKDSNPIEPNPSTPPAKPKKPVYAETNPIEPNPSTPPVKPKKPVYADANPIEPNPTEPPAGHEKPEDTDLNLVEPNHGNSTNDGAKPDSGTLESGVNTEGDTFQKNAVKTNQQQTEDVALKWGTENFKTTNKNDMLAAYYDDKVTKKKLNFNEVIDERGKNLPMQKDKNGKVIYPSICQYASVAGSINLAGHDYKEV